MEFLGIGPTELLLILIIMLVVLGPQDMVKMGKQLSQGVRKVIQSPTWKSMMSTSQELRELPTKLVRETGLEEDLAEIRKSTQAIKTPLDKDLKSILSTSVTVPATPAKVKDVKKAAPNNGQTGPTEPQKPDEAKADTVPAVLSQEDGTPENSLQDPKVEESSEPNLEN